MFLKKNVLSRGGSIVTTEEYIASRLRTLSKSITGLHKKFLKKNNKTGFRYRFQKLYYKLIRIKKHKT